MKDTTQNFPAMCEVRIANIASAYYNMRGFICGRDVATQTVQVAIVGGPIKTCGTECLVRVR